MISKVILIGNSDEFVYSMRLFPELLDRLLRERGIAVESIRPRTVLGKLAPWVGPLGKWLFYIDKFVLFPFTLRRVIRRERAPGVVAHLCDHSNAMQVRYLRDIPHVVTCHDMMPIRSARGEIPQNPTSWTGKCFQQLILNGLKRAGFTACVSSATQRDLLRLTGGSPENTRVVLMSLNYDYTPMPLAEARARICALTRMESPYILHVGGGSWYKNRRGALEIYARTRRLMAGRSSFPKLIYTGPPLDAEIGSMAAEYPELASNVIRLSGVDPETLRALYSAAELLLFPSWDEGFGWPIIEGQACGCRVVTTNREPMTEVGGDAAFYIDPHDPEGAAAKIVELLDQTPDQRALAVQKGLANLARFSETRMIEGYLGIYQTVLSQP
jgi:glycosyltransferase involved in cell wall biosynthesis